MSGFAYFLRNMKVSMLLMLLTFGVVVQPNVCFAQDEPSVNTRKSRQQSYALISAVGPHHEPERNGEAGSTSTGEWNR